MAFPIGVIAGLRTMTAPAAVSWAAHLGVIHLEGTRLAFLGRSITPWVLTLAALGELVVDQLPSTPSRKVPVQLAGRVLSGAFAGGAVGLAAGSWPAGLALGVVGAIFGTLAGASARSRLAARFSEDRPAAVIEDVVAIGGAALAMAMVA
jgi:uncharacterized membrane protein